MQLRDVAEVYDEERNEFRFQRGVDESGFPEEEEPLRYVRGAKQDTQALGEYIVVNDRVAVRKQPNTEARVLDVLERGRIVKVFGFDETRTWCKTHVTLRGGIGGTVEAWIMIWHSVLGDLLEPTDGRESAAQTEQGALQQHVARAGRVDAGQPPQRRKQRRQESAEEHRAPALKGAELIVANEPWHFVASKGGEALAADEPDVPRRFVPLVREGEANAATEPDALPHREPARRKEEIIVVKEPEVPQHRGRAGRHLEAVVKNHSWSVLTQEDLIYCISEMGLASKDPVETVTTSDGTQVACCSDILKLMDAGNCQYEVVRRPIVVARNAPHSTAKMMDGLRFDTIVDTYGKDESGKWVRVFGQFGSTQYLGMAWVLIQHAEFGTFLKPLF